MASEMALSRELWKYQTKKSLPQMAQLRCRKSRFIAIGKLSFLSTDEFAYHHQFVNFKHDFTWFDFMLSGQ
jgi:hypothetical protein